MTPQQRYYLKNKERLLKESRERYYNNIESERSRAQVYYAKNIEHLKLKRNIRAKRSRQENISFKLKSNVSRRIRHVLKMVGSSKSGQSILSFLNYSIIDLQKSLENQFESWMSWKNYGTYRVKSWKDTDSSTWTWQIDHIIPQSKLPYSSMQDDNFKKCWSLENLRPLSSKENFIKGNR